MVWTPLKNISQLGWLFPIHGKIENVPNHQPVYRSHQPSVYTNIIIPPNCMICWSMDNWLKILESPYHKVCKNQPEYFYHIVGVFVQTDIRSTLVDDLPIISVSYLHQGSHCSKYVLIINIVNIWVYLHILIISSFRLNISLVSCLFDVPRKSLLAIYVVNVGWFLMPIINNYIYTIVELFPLIHESNARMLGCLECGMVQCLEGWRVGWLDGFGWFLFHSCLLSYDLLPVSWILLPVVS